jgi:hypothetical protein
MVAGPFRPTPAVSMPTWRQSYTAHSRIVAKRRERIAEILGNLGIPDGPVHTGSTR